MPSKKPNQPTQASRCVPHAGRLTSLRYIKSESSGGIQKKTPARTLKAEPSAGGQLAEQHHQMISDMPVEKADYVVLSVVYKVLDHDVSSVSFCSCLLVALLASLTVCLTKITC